MPVTTGLPGRCALRASKVLVHAFVLASVIMGISWICGSDTLVATTHCAEGEGAVGGGGYGYMDPDLTGSQALEDITCTTVEGLGGFSGPMASASWAPVNNSFPAQGFDATLDHNTWHYFNWHPLLMTIGFILCYMEGAIVFRVLPLSWGKARKWIHGISMTVATGCGVAGTVCIFKYKAKSNPAIYKSPLPKMASIHSWIGLAAVVLFSLQFLFGLVFFALSQNKAMRTKLIATHRMVGILVGVFTAAAIISGVMDRQAQYQEEPGIVPANMPPCELQPSNRPSLSPTATNVAMRTAVVEGPRITSRTFAACLVLNHGCRLAVLLLKCS